MQGTEAEMAGEGRSKGDFGRFLVPGFPDQDDVGIVAQEVTQEHPSTAGSFWSRRPVT